MTHDGKSVRDLFFIPKYLFTPRAIIKRPPQKNGRVGCYIVCAAIPEQGKVAIVRDGACVNKQEALRRACQANALKEDDIDVRGRLFDILNIVISLTNPIFTLDDVSAHAEELSKKHRGEHDIQKMIRAQLQIMRDRGIIEFVAKGLYKKVWSFTEI